MGTKHTSLQIGNVNDHVQAIAGVTYDCTVSALVADPENDFYLTANANGQTDLCLEVEDTEPDYTGTFLEYGTGNPYTTVSYDFDLSVIGGRPTVRCPKCVF